MCFSKFVINSSCSDVEMTMLCQETTKIVFKVCLSRWSLITCERGTFAMGLLFLVNDLG